MSRWMHIENLSFMKNLFKLFSSKFSFREQFSLEMDSFLIAFLVSYVLTFKTADSVVIKVSIIPIMWSRPIFSDGDSAHRV